MRSSGVSIWCLAVTLCLARSAWADGDAVPMPAHQAEQATATTDDAAIYPVRPWLLPPLMVPGARRSGLREEERIGRYGQPRWTANRRFPATRIFVVPAGKVTVEYWSRWDAPLASLLEKRKIQNYYEIEFGLGHRLQMDIYVVTMQDGWKSPITTQKEKFELRYALADWGKLWGNPTLYLEWSREGGDPDFLEGKLLLGGEVAPRWHAGANLLLERKMGNNFSNEYGLTTGLSYTLTDEGLSVGVEAKASLLDEKGQRLHFNEQEYYAGPSLAWTPIPPMHILATVLAGVGKNGGQSEGLWQSWFIAGWTF